MVVTLFTSSSIYDHSDFQANWFVPLVLLSTFVISTVTGNTECVRQPVNNNSHDLSNYDDKMGSTMANNSDGHFNVEDCAGNREWIPRINNQPETSEFYNIGGFFHRCRQACAMQRHLIPLNAWVMLLLMRLAYAGHKCVWIHGTVHCHKDPAKNLNVEVRVYDRDGLSIAKIIDPDDLMGVTFTNEDGSFQLDGCGADIDWIPGIPNYPEPYLQILHYCNSQTGEILRLPPFRTFVPKTHEIGTINLDLPIQVSPAENNAKLMN
ncbi:unnamed protein product [Cercopithifilaria johnstoni]|uniref:Transthyretin-like family protein n=1 Tax=Cercopithifilaria johnstoni TaxID=2874296 RepID=A0A8J2LZ97_9BILA|nr:unnamed protein product [Cercopithifilaria johnstoni]